MISKNLLVITDGYPPKNEIENYGIFVKELVHALSMYIPKIYVYSSLPLRKKSIFSKIFYINYSVSNIDVKYIRVPLITQLPLFVRKIMSTIASTYILNQIKKPRNIGLINAHFIWPSGYLGVKIKEYTNIPIIITAHGYDVYDLPFRNMYWYKLAQYVIYMADHIVTVSNKNKEMLISRLGANPNKITVIPNGYDPNKFRPLNKTYVRTLLGLPHNKKILLNVANLVPVKGHIYLLYAFRELLKEYKDVILIIVGGGPLFDTLKKYCKILGIANNVIFTLQRPHKEIPLWMNAADLFVLPSINEGSPTVIFEALGVGLPIIATNVGGIPEIISSEEIGYLCKPKDVTCLSQKIIEGLKKQWNRSYIIEYSKQFTWDNIAKKYLEIFKMYIS